MIAEDRRAPARIEEATEAVSRLEDLASQDAS
jgi:hypothetical protein